MKLKYLFLLIFGITLLSNCSDGIPKVEIDEDLAIYFDRFVEEGAKRGVTIDYSIEGMEAKIVTIHGNVAGQCSYAENIDSEILIDQHIWANLNEDRREFLVFHELGHCMLKRMHLDDKDENGYCVSLMHSSTDACILDYRDITRSSYLDELFNY